MKKTVHLYTYDITRYTSYELSEMLKVNEETVRRWIRGKRLFANYETTGYEITPESLLIFLDNNRKYKERLSTEFIKDLTITAEEEKNLNLYLSCIRHKCMETD